MDVTEQRGLRMWRQQMPSLLVQHPQRSTCRFIRLACSVLVLVVALMAVLCACARPQSNDEAIICQGIENSVASLKALSTSKDAQLELSSEQRELLSLYGLDSSLVMELLLRKLSVSVSALGLREDTAQAQLTVTNVDLEALIQTLERKAELWSQSPEASQLVESSGELAVTQKLFAFLEELLDSPSVPLKTHRLSLSLHKDSEGVWSIDDEQAFARALLADSTEAS